MAIPILPNVHDTCLASFELGPRREVTLVLTQSRHSRELRFGAIENFDAVTAFFSALERPPPGAFYDQVEFLRYSERKPSTAKRLHLDLGFDQAGIVPIACSKFAVLGAPDA